MLAATFVFFFVYNLAITPVCFVKIFLHKMVMIFVYSKSHRLSRADKFMQWVTFAIIGLPRLYRNVLFDNLAFLQHAVTDSIKKQKTNINDQQIDRLNMRIV